MYTYIYIYVVTYVHTDNTNTNTNTIQIIRIIRNTKDSPSYYLTLICYRSPD